MSKTMIIGGRAGKAIKDIENKKKQILQMMAVDKFGCCIKLHVDNAQNDLHTGVVGN